MNSEAALFFLILLIISVTFGGLLFILSHIFNRRELLYMCWSFVLKGVLSIGPALLMFHVDNSWTAYLTGSVKVTLIPFAYLYFKKLSSKNKSLVSHDLWHFVPFFFSLILTFIFVPGHEHEIVGQREESLVSTMKMIWDDSFQHNVLAITSRVISFSQALVYSFLVFKLFKRYLLLVKDNDSLITHYNTLWIKWVVIIMLLQGFFEGFSLIGIYNFQIMFVLGFVFQIFYVFFFVIHAIVQKDLAPFIPIEEPIVEKDSKNDVQVLLTKFREGELFLIPDIGLEETAHQLNVSKTSLTQIIKDAGFDNFYDFINEHRIERSKKLLLRMPENHVIESVIEQSGFKSRSTFYRVFKQKTGQTPSEFLAERDT